MWEPIQDRASRGPSQCREGGLLLAERFEQMKHTLIQLMFNITENIFCLNCASFLNYVGMFQSVMSLDKLC